VLQGCDKKKGNSTIMQSNHVNLAIKYSQTEIDTFQRLLQTIATGNMGKLRELMFKLNLSQLSRFKQFRHDVLIGKYATH